MSDLIETEGKNIYTIKREALSQDRDKFPMSEKSFTTLENLAKQIRFQI